MKKPQKNIHAYIVKWLGKDLANVAKHKTYEIDLFVQKKIVRVNIGTAELWDSDRIRYPL